MITHFQIGQLAEICREASDVEILPRFRALDPEHIDEKSSFDDLVTIADQAAEKLILKRLQELFPDALLIGEESVYEDPQALEKFEDAELSFIVDPIDGTWHFANGSSAFGILLAVASKGVTQAAMIYEPVTGDYQWAIKGAGAFECANGKNIPLQVGRHSERPIADTICTFSFGVFKNEDRVRAINAASQMGRIMDYRCSAMEYRLFNTAATAFAIHRGVLNLWDHAPGLLIATEAGGVARMLTGEQYHADSEGILIVAESEERWQEVAALFA